MQEPTPPGNAGGARNLHQVPGLSFKRGKRSRRGSGEDGGSQAPTTAGGGSLAWTNQ
jgi:hypothetical protein